MLISRVWSGVGRVKPRKRPTLYWPTHLEANWFLSDTRSGPARLLSTDTLGDQRTRISQIWAPSGGITPASHEDAHSKLIRGGFLRQAHSGIFHLLPLGQRVQKKIERLIDKHMIALGASKVELSSISSEDLWHRSGRLANVNSELFRFQDRRDARYLLSPTHEEEITCIAAGAVRSYKELPIRLYQISRKYRDELRPRHGLLRSREFVMKDLYTFDYNISLALETYHLVRAAYTALFDELKIAYLVAEADSGTMGGDLSHEFHFPTPKGEDHVISCRKCDYVANEELAECAVPKVDRMETGDEWSYVHLTEQGSRNGNGLFSLWRGISLDRKKLINVWYGSANGAEVNTHAVKMVVPDLDPGISDATTIWSRLNRLDAPLKDSTTILNLVDCRLPVSVLKRIKSLDPDLPIWPAASVPSSVEATMITKECSTNQPLNLLRIADGDACPRCTSGKLKIQKAIELGHTFFLGTRYSVPLQATVRVPASLLSSQDFSSTSSGSATSAQNSTSNIQIPMQMGCHGIGVSRMIGAVAEALSDERGLNWPRVIAPYEAVVISVKGLENDALSVYDVLSADEKENESKSAIDVVLDDRDHAFAWKMQDADLIGYPVLVVVGKSWKLERTCEVQCRRLKIRQQVPLSDLHLFVSGLLAQL